jgi:lipoate-protein ligase A
LNTKLLDLTLATAAENLALDEALLDAVARGELAHDVLRVWELTDYAVVMGRSTRRDQEVNESACQQRGVQVVRRVSGGASIVAGPGCLMYSLVMSEPATDKLTAVDAVHHRVLPRLAAAIASVVPTVTVAGTSDLAMLATDGVLRKVSGNSLRIRRGAVLYHGTLLYDFDLSLVATCLATPPRMPDYRVERPHERFVANLPVGRDALAAALAAAWRAESPLTTWPAEAVAKLAAERYNTAVWNA